MEHFSPDEALVRLESRLAADEAKVAQSVGLRGAQIKYVVRRLQDHLRANEKGAAALEQVLPPMSVSELIPYARDAHAMFEREIQPGLQRQRPSTLSPGEWNALVQELEEVLIEIRRIVVQNLSKHPAIKPFRLLSEWDRVREERIQWERAWEENERVRRAWEHAWNKAREESSALALEKGADTFFRLEGSRNELLDQKKRMMEEWMRVWRQVEPIFSRLVEKAKTFQHMENAQARVVQLYLANPVSARTKDAHGAGLLMMLRLAVDALEEKKSGLSKQEKETARETILSALESSFFTHYFEYMHGLESALDKNQQEFISHPLHARRAAIEIREREALRAWNAVNEDEEKIVQARSESEEKMKRVQREVDEACRLNGIMSIRWDE